MKWIYIIICVIWICFAVAISVGIYYTKDMRCLWFFLMPILMTNIKAKS